jgi:hypothetical protein
MFKEIIALYTENHAKPINVKCRAADVEAADTYTHTGESLVVLI